MPITPANIDVAVADGKGVDLRPAVDELRPRGATRMHVTWHPGEGGAAGFHRRIAFELTGETSGGQTVLVPAV
ncbi:MULTISPECIES: hypothetical protein [unclassified Nonomuraea]|uniref:hypothetical protein n=1 Tax=unclassified Nonomuraea TaxID=2593643 RepID=UPI00340275B4